MFGREREVELLNGLLEGVREGRSAPLAVHGEPGIGKSALLQYVVEAGKGLPIARTFGIEAEMELPFSALQQLCAPFFGLMNRLPQPQHDALGVAFGISDGPAPDLFLVGLALLGLLAEAAENQPLICVVDDAQWLDSASARTLTFAARRLVAEKLALIFATRELGDVFAGLPELHVRPLLRRDARAILESALPARLDERVLERIVIEARGNPLALIELPRGLTAAELAGGFGLPTTVPIATRIEEGYIRRLAKLPYDARRLLLVAAADPVGDPALVWRAAERLGISQSVANTVESDHLLTLSPRVAFDHPLVRSAVYRAAELDERREAHRALAEATDPKVDPDRRAWHRAQAASVPDEDVAVELEQSAGRALARGGFAAAAAFLERAVALSLDSSRRSQRALAAAQAKFQAGALEDALDLLMTAESDNGANQVVRAHADLLRGRIAFASRRGSDAAPQFLAAARELETVDPCLARMTYLEALSAAMFAGRLAHDGDVVCVSEAALAGPPMPETPGPTDLLLQGLALQFTKGYVLGAPLLKEALATFRREDDQSAKESPWLFLASWVALSMWDDASWEVLSTRHLRLVRRTSELSMLPFVLDFRGGVSAFRGGLTAAESLEEEARAVTEATGIATFPYCRLAIAALRGREAEFSALVRRTVDQAKAWGEGNAMTMAEFLSGTLYNGLGRYDATLEAVEFVERVYAGGAAIWALTELIEAAVRCGKSERAQAAFEHVQESTRTAGTDWALGIEARSRALLSDRDEADSLYREAIVRLSRTSIRVQLGRAHLLYGEWLRRERRRMEAREQLRTAYELFRDFGVETFAERAARELLATGEHARKRSVDTLDQLTPQEAQIARLASQGETNREIAVRLFISASTVEYHLYKVYRKLAVKSRTELAHRLR